MARRSGMEETLARLAEIAKGPLTSGAKDEFRAALSKGGHVVAAKAAQIAAKAKAGDLIPDLAAAFGRFMERPDKTDKQCIAKNAIADALNALSCEGEDIFLRGIRHVQMEPVYGGKADTASALRGKCASGLARIGYRDLFFELADLLMDPVPGARRDAVKAVACMPTEKGELLLRMKVLAGDKDPDVTADCLNALAAMAPGRSVDFLARFLDGNDPAAAHDAAMALGNSREPRALEILRTHYESEADCDRKKALLLAVALTRRDEAFDFLVAAIRAEPGPLAAAAVGALRAAGSDERRREIVREAVVARNDPAVNNAYEEGGWPRA